MRAEWRNCTPTMCSNHPSGEEGVVLNLLMYKDKVVGADVMSPRLDGFMHSLEMPPEM